MKGVKKPHSGRKRAEGRAWKERSGQREEGSGQSVRQMKGAEIEERGRGGLGFYVSSESQGGGGVACKKQ